MISTVIETSYDLVTGAGEIKKSYTRLAKSISNENLQDFSSLIEKFNSESTKKLGQYKKDFLELKVGAKSKKSMRIWSDTFIKYRNYYKNRFDEILNQSIEVSYYVKKASHLNLEIWSDLNEFNIKLDSMSMFKHACREHNKVVSKIDAFKFEIIDFLKEIKIIQIKYENPTLANI